MYKENQELELIQDVGKKDSPKFLPKGTKVKFIKVVDFEYRSFVSVSYEDRVFTLPELAVKPVGIDTLKELKKFNSKLMESNPELKKYHHNVFMRFYYRIIDFFKNKLTKKPKQNKISDRDLDNLKKFLNKGSEVE